MENEDGFGQGADNGVLNFENDEMQESDDGMEEMMSDQKKKTSDANVSGQQNKVDGEKLDNQPYDLAVDVNDSEEIESDEDADEVNEME